jgi:hypothetical protein
VGSGEQGAFTFWAALTFGPAWASVGTHTGPVLFFVWATHV